MRELKFHVKKEDELSEVARTLENEGAIRKGVPVLLVGELGSGKTAFVRKFCENKGYFGVRSPSFTIMYIYSLPSGEEVVHVDLYRLSEEELPGTGVLEEFVEDRFIFVEWGEKAEKFLAERVIMKFIILNERERSVIVEF